VAAPTRGDEHGYESELSLAEQSDAADVQKSHAFCKRRAECAPFQHAADLSVGLQSHEDHVERPFLPAER
jgi:hypothetical protein